MQISITVRPNFLMANCQRISLYCSVTYTTNILEINSNVTWQKIKLTPGDIT